MSYIHMLFQTVILRGNRIDILMDRVQLSLAPAKLPALPSNVHVKADSLLQHTHLRSLPALIAAGILAVASRTAILHVGIAILQSRLLFGHAGLLHQQPLLWQGAATLLAHFRVISIPDVGKHKLHQLGPGHSVWFV